MAFVHGKTTTVLADEYDLSSYFNQVQSSRSIQVTNTTTFGNDDKTYIHGLEEGSISIQGLGDFDTNNLDSIMDAAVGTETIFTVAIDGADEAADLGNVCIMMKAETAGYDIRSTASDAVRVVVAGTADGGVRNGRLLQDTIAETATANGSSIDDAASSANGGVGHLHAIAASAGDTLDVKIQDSPDNSAWADLITFTQVGASAAAERLTVTGTVDRYLRAIWTIGGVSPSYQFAVAFARNRRA